MHNNYNITSYKNLYINVFINVRRFNNFFLNEKHELIIKKFILSLLI